MSHKFWLVVLGTSVVSVLFWIGFVAPDASQAQLPIPPTASEQRAPDVPRAAASDHSAGASGNESTVAGLDEQSLPPADILPVAVDEIAANPSDDSSPFAALAEPPSAMQATWYEVAAAYAASSQTPSYSIPLQPEQVSAYRGNAYEPVSLPMVTGAVMRVALPQLRYQQGETVSITAEVSGASQIEETMSVRLLAVSDESMAETTQLKRGTLDEAFMGEMSTTSASPGEYRLIVTARIDGETIHHVSLLVVEPDIGAVIGIGDTLVEGNHLVVPVQFQALTAGRYAVSANLFTGTQPIAHLTGESNLAEGQGAIALKVYGSLLVGIDLRHGLHLMDVQVRRLPARPGSRTAYGFGAAAGYPVAIPSLESLQDTPYSDELTQQRIDFLNSLGQAQ
ncbi:MAG: hypothetical protein JXQ97_08845 [Natronospirillum sp.]